MRPIRMEADARDDPALLSPTDVVDSDDSMLRSKAAAVAGTGNAPERLGRLFLFVRDAVAYDIRPHLSDRASWRASGTLARSAGFCQQKALLLTAMARAADIPAAVSFQVIRDHHLPSHYVQELGSNVLRWHGLVAARIGDRVVRVDPTVDAARCARHRIRLVTFDGSGDALLPNTSTDGGPSFEILEEQGCFADLPDEAYEPLIEQGRVVETLRE